MRIINSNKYVITIVCVFCVLLTSACNQEIEKENINFRITWEAHSGRGETISNIVEEFNNESELYEVTLVGGNEDYQQITDELSQSEIDLFMMPYRYIQDETISKELVSLSELYDNYDDFDESMISLGSYNGELKGIPWIGHSMCLVFNADLCKSAGVNPYEWHSMNDLVEACKQMVEETDARALGLSGSNNHDTAWMVNQFIYTFGGSLVSQSEEVEEIVVNSLESVEAIKFYRDTLGEYAQENWEEHSGVEVLELFSQSKIAFEIQGPWAITDIWKKGRPFDVGVISLDQIGIYSEVGPIMLSISQNSQHIEGAREFIRFLESDSSLSMILDGEYSPKYDAYYPFRIPIRKGFEDSLFYQKYPEFLPFSEGFKLPSISAPSPLWAKVQNELYPEMLHKIMLKEISIEEGLSRVVQ